MSKVSADWWALGIQLGLTADELRAIRVNNPHDVARCMSDMLDKWLSKYPQQGWLDVVRSLRTMQRNDIADDVASKYCNSTADSGM